MRANQIARIISDFKMHIVKHLLSYHSKNIFLCGLIRNENFRNIFESGLIKLSMDTFEATNLWILGLVERIRLLFT